MASILNHTLYANHIALTSRNASVWQSENPVLLNGELGIESDSLRIKIGNGTDSWNNIAYVDANIQSAITNIYQRLDMLENLAEALLDLTNAVIGNIQKGERLIYG